MYVESASGSITIKISNHNSDMVTVSCPSLIRESSLEMCHDIPYLLEEKKRSVSVLMKLAQS